MANQYDEKNQAGKLTSFYVDKNTKKIYVGVQGTSEWYSFKSDEKDKANQKYKELLKSDIK